jgi:hypothetical protein
MQCIERIALIQSDLLPGCKWYTFVSHVAIISRCIAWTSRQAGWLARLLYLNMASAQVEVGDLKLVFMDYAASVV